MKKITMLALATLLCASLTPKVLADVSDNETYTVTIPAAVYVSLTTGGSTNFGTINASELKTPAGSNNASSHVLTLGNGDASTSTSYIQTNGGGAGEQEYTLTFASVGSSQVTVTDDAANNRAKLNLKNSGSTADVDILLTNSAQNGYPSLGTNTKLFSVTSTTGMHVAASSSVGFDGTSHKAPLDMKMDLDESSLSMSDSSGDIQFSLTLTCVGLN